MFHTRKEKICFSFICSIRKRKRKNRRKSKKNELNVRKCSTNERLTKDLSNHLTKSSNKVTNRMSFERFLVEEFVQEEIRRSFLTNCRKVFSKFRRKISANFSRKKRRIVVKDFR